MKKFIKQLIDEKAYVRIVPRGEFDRWTTGIITNIVESFKYDIKDGMTNVQTDDDYIIIEEQGKTKKLRRLIATEDIKAIEEVET